MSLSWHLYLTFLKSVLPIIISAVVAALGFFVAYAKDIGPRAKTSRHIDECTKRLQFLDLSLKTQQTLRSLTEFERHEADIDLAKIKRDLKEGLTALQDPSTWTLRQFLEHRQAVSPIRRFFLFYKQPSKTIRFLKVGMTAIAIEPFLANLLKVIPATAVGDAPISVTTILFSALLGIMVFTFGRRLLSILEFLHMIEMANREEEKKGTSAKSFSLMPGEEQQRTINGETNRRLPVSKVLGLETSSTEGGPVEDTKGNLLIKAQQILKSFEGE